ncbi:hypothetical protein [Woeseia oceani]|uniref:Uncharacterized protein n=1 Tax=Woeseia oceani TaxID=1548547 RepID=A0A193LJ19_9GAMM|nr:hypothetical protein [Woeseia oceani]ANO52525.1 hypothetical protein BA177_16235 [Woeseia oceani]
MNAWTVRRAGLAARELLHEDAGLFHCPSAPESGQTSRALIAEITGAMDTEPNAVSPGEPVFWQLKPQFGERLNSWVVTSAAILPG